MSQYEHKYIFTKEHMTKKEIEEQNKLGWELGGFLTDDSEGFRYSFIREIKG